MAIATLIEFLKLYQGAWIEALRSGTIGAFLMGREFQLGNFVAYAAGCGVAVTLDRFVLRRGLPRMDILPK